MAAALVESFISHLSSRDDLEKAAVTVAEGIKDYSTGKKRIFHFTGNSRKRYNRFCVSVR